MKEKLAIIAAALGGVSVTIEPIMNSTGLPRGLGILSLAFFAVAIAILFIPKS